MDGESSCESDISDSWSIVDLNSSKQTSDLNQSIDIDNPARLQASPIKSVKNGSRFKNSKENSLENFEMMEFSKSNEVKELDITLKNKLEEPENIQNGYPLNFQDFVILNQEKNLEINEGDDNVIEDVNSKACDCESDCILNGDYKARDTDFDTDGISVISEGECDDTKYCCTENDGNQSEQASTEYINKSPEKSNSSVIRKKRKRTREYVDSSDDNLNSDLVIPDRRNSSINATNVTDHDDEMQVAVTSSKPVYRHYRNNVANTVLSLAMGVIFAGVACIALGHFLGVHDAEQTAGEMMEALKRLQMENIALHSRLSHLSRVFFTRESQPKPQFTNIELPNCPEKDSSISEESEHSNDPVKNDNINNINNINLKSSEWLSRLQKSVTDDKFVNMDDRVKIINIVNRIHDGFTLVKKISDKNQVKMKKIEEIDLKISKFLQKNIENVIKSQAGLDKALSRLTKLSDKLEKKICKNFPGAIEGLICDKYKEKKLNGKKEAKDDNPNSFQWHPSEEEVEYPVAKSSDSTDLECVYKFPPAECFEKRADDKTDANEDLGVCEVDEVEKTDAATRQSKPLRREIQDEGEKSAEEVVAEPENEVKESVNVDFLEMKKQERKREPFRKILKNPSKKLRNQENPDKTKKYYKNYVKKEYQKNWKSGDKSKSKFNRKNVHNEKKLKDYLNTKIRFVKEKFQKLPKINRKSLKKEYLNERNNDYGRFNIVKTDKCESSCFNVSGNWVYKLAKGREQCRKYKRLSDWQFDRAKGREALREADEINWFFERAAGRQNDRDDAKWYFRRNDARNHQRRNFSPENLSWI